MNNAWQQRTLALLGSDALTALRAARVAVLGLGGVGAAAAEGLCRAGVGHLLLADRDTVADSNRNRQWFATAGAVGRPKTEAARDRLRSVNPEGDFFMVGEFLLPDNLHLLFDWRPDCVVDAIDTVTTKLALARACRARGVALFMSMGTGGRLDPTQLRAGRLSDTGGCGCALSRVLRRALRAEGLLDLPVVYSLEPPSRAVVESDVPGRHPPSSSPFVPPAAGLALASMAARWLIETARDQSPWAKPDDLRSV